MKTTLTLCLALATLGSAQAQIFRPEAVNGALLGGIAGAVIGHNSGSLNHNGWQGAAIGAGAGLLIGAAISDSNHTQVARPSGYVYRDAPAAYYGTSYGYGHGYGRPVYRSNYGYGYPNHAGNGLILGGITGAIIGRNSGSFGHNAWRGAAWGAGAGWLLGAIADSNYYRREAYYERPVVVTEAPAAPAQPAPAAAPQQVTIINNYYGNATPAAPMAAANGLFGRP